MRKRESALVFYLCMILVSLSGAVLISSTIMDWIIVFVGVLMLLIGLIGCVFPIIPGPPIAYLALLLLLLHSTAEVGTNVLIWLGAAVVAVTVLDFILPVWGTKRSGGTKAGRIGSTIGLIIGVFLTPVMIILGPLVGAILGELIVGQSRKTAFRSGLGSFIGFLTGTFLKIIVTGFIANYFIRALM